MRKFQWMSAALFLVVVLSGCSLFGGPSQREPRVGQIVISIAKPASTQGATTQAISPEATGARIRVYNSDRSTDIVVDVQIPSDGSTVTKTITVPVGSGYTVDALTYAPSTNVTNVRAILDGGRATGITVSEGTTTTVDIALQRYTLDLDLGNVVAPKRRALQQR